MFRSKDLWDDQQPVELKGDCERCPQTDCKDNNTPEHIIDEGRVSMSECVCFDIDPDKVPL